MRVDARLATCRATLVGYKPGDRLAAFAPMTTGFGLRLARALPTGFGLRGAVRPLHLDTLASLAANTAERERRRVIVPRPCCPGAVAVAATTKGVGAIR